MKRGGGGGNQNTLTSRVIHLGVRIKRMMSNEVIEKVGECGGGGGRQGLKKLSLLTHM